MMWQSAGYTLPAIQAELRADERVLWNGQPLPGTRLRGVDALLIPFSLLWGGGAVAAFVSELRKGTDPVSIGFLGLFVLVGLYIVVGRFFVDAYVRRKTFYAVTNERVLAVSEAFGRKVRTLSLRTLPEMMLREGRDGSGDILFGPPGPYDMWSGVGWPGMGAYQSARFESLSDVRAVFNLIQDAQQKVR
jgi:hypothetical protein